MCDNGVNVDQMRLSLDQSQTTLGLVGQWLGHSAHMAGHAKRAEAADAIARAQQLVEEAAGLVRSTVHDLSSEPSGAVTVEKV